MNSLPRKRVLILAEHFAPAYKAGGIVRCLENLVLGFEDKYDFRILTSNRNLNRSEELTGIKCNEWTAFSGRTKILYASPEKQKRITFEETVAAFQPDVIYINGIYSKFFTLLPVLLCKGKKKPKIVIAPWGMLHKGCLSIKPLKKKFFFFTVKLSGLFNKVLWHATNEQEKTDIIHMFGVDAKIVVANAVPASPNMTLLQNLKTPKLLKLISVSLVTPNKGHLRVLQALKELDGVINAEFHIYGPVKDIAFWQTCLDEIASLKLTIHVIYHGFIEPADLLPALQASHFFILHSDGENFCQAIYESLIAGRPVITSDQTPWNYLHQDKAGFNVPVNDVEELKRAIKRAYTMTQSEYETFCLGAQQKARQLIAESSFEEQYDALF